MEPPNKLKERIKTLIIFICTGYLLSSLITGIVKAQNSVESLVRAFFNLELSTITYAQETTVTSEQTANSVGNWTMTNWEYLRMVAIGEGVDPDLAEAIVRAECGSCMEIGKMIKNANSSALGPWQIIDGTWDSTINKMGWVEADRNSLIDNILVGIWLLKHEGSEHWNASKHNWIDKI